MKSVVVNKKMEVSKAGASAFRNMAVWEGGYNICLDVCKAADSFDKSNAVTEQLRKTAATIPLHLSASASFRPGKQYILGLKRTFVSVRQLKTLLMLCHDLHYISSEGYHELDSDIDKFMSKILKYTRKLERNKS